MARVKSYWVTNQWLELQSRNITSMSWKYFHYLTTLWGQNTNMNLRYTCSNLQLSVEIFTNRNYSGNKNLSEVRTKKYWYLNSAKTLGYGQTSVPILFYCLICKIIMKAYHHSSKMFVFWEQFDTEISETKLGVLRLRPTFLESWSHCRDWGRDFFFSGLNIETETDTFRFSVNVETETYF